MTKNEVKDLELPRVHPQEVYTLSPQKVYPTQKEARDVAEELAERVRAIALEYGMHSLTVTGEIAIAAGQTNAFIAVFIGCPYCSGLAMQRGLVAGSQLPNHQGDRIFRGFQDGAIADVVRDAAVMAMAEEAKKKGADA